MQYQIDLLYSESLLRRAVLCFWWRVTGWWYLASLLLLATCLILALLRGDTSWAIGVIATVLVLAVVLMVWLYVAHYRNSLRKFRQMGSPQASLIASESTFTLSSNAGTSTLQWSMITEVWQFPDFWLLFFSKAQFFTLPLAGAALDSTNFVLERIQHFGGKVCLMSQAAAAR